MSIRQRIPSQTGVVSLLITMIMMLVITLIVIGFAQVSRHEQRQQLDRNLSTEAFYAAESGINEAINAIRSQPYGTNIDKTTCDVGTSASSVQYLGKTLKPVLDGSGDVAYTCMLVSSASLTTLSYSVPSDGSSMVLPVRPASGTPLDTIRLNWTMLPSPASPAAADPASCTSGATFPQVTGYGSCPYGVLRLDLVALPNGNMNQANLSAGQKTIFLYPTPGGGNPAVQYATMDGTTRPMNCSTSGCTIDIALSGGAVNYALRAMAVYHDGHLDVQGLNAGTPQVLTGAQAQIDVTGRAQDVLRRIQVRIPLIKQGDPSNYALESAGSICKRFRVGQNYFEIPNNALKNDTNNPMCIVVPPPPNSCSKPKDILLALDYSNSVATAIMADGNTAIDDEKSAADNFVSTAALSQPGNHLGLMTFNATEDFKTAYGFTYNKQPVINDINTTPTVTGTYINQVLSQSNALLMGTNYNSRPIVTANKTLVLFTDGNPGRNENDTLIKAAADTLRASGVVVYVIGFQTADTRADLMQYIAANGGFTRLVKSAASASSGFNDILKDIECR